MTEKPDLTLDDLVTELADRRGITIHRVSVWRLLRGLDLIPMALSTDLCPGT